MIEIAYLAHYLTYSANDVMSGAGSNWLHHAFVVISGYGDVARTHAAGYLQALEKGGITD